MRRIYTGVLIALAALLVLLLLGGSRHASRPHRLAGVVPTATIMVTPEVERPLDAGVILASYTKLERQKETWIWLRSMQIGGTRIQRPALVEERHNPQPLVLEPYRQFLLE